MNILSLHPTHIPEAAELFATAFRRQRRAVPGLPARMEDPAAAARLLDGMPGIVALENGQVGGYLVWFVADRFRGTARKGAYCPEWGHACVAENPAAVYRAMYRAAAQAWAEAGCQTHAITVFAGDQDAVEAWFWNGFGLAVVDAARPMRPLDAPRATGLRIRPATALDAQDLAALDAEHCRHYAESPVFMPPHAGESAADFAEFLVRPDNSIWLALDGDQLAGFIRFDAHDSDKSASVTSASSVYITGAYVRPACRGRRAAEAMLDAGLRHYAGSAYTCCAVDFESFNPEAAAFWPRYFKPVCFSMMRVPENL
jgi:ribosomal protein S18 acetylase RimI-like enzyme